MLEPGCYLGIPALLRASGKDTVKVGSAKIAPMFALRRIVGNPRFSALEYLSYVLNWSGS